MSDLRGSIRPGRRARRRSRLPWAAAAAALALLLLAAAFLALRPEDGAAPPAAPPPATAPAADASPTPPPATAEATPSAPPTAEAPPPSPTPDAEPPTATPAPAAPPSIEVSPTLVPTGETLLVVADPGGAASGATAARLEFRDGSWPLMRDGDRFWGVFAVPLGADLGPDSLAVTWLDGFGAPLASLAASYEVVDAGRPVETIELTPGQASVLTAEAAARETELRGAQFATFDPEPRWTGPFAVPVDAPLTSGFGHARSYDGGVTATGFHGGADYGAPQGAPVRSAGPGRVGWTGEMPIRGLSVIVDHGGGVLSGYHHLSRLDAAVGDAVEAGSPLGAIGSTGLSTGPHLHWEITIWGVAVDPLTWLDRAFLPPPADAGGAS